MFSSLKIAGLLLIATVIGFAVVKFELVKNQLDKTTANLVLEQSNNTTLRDNQQTLTQLNKANSEQLLALKRDQEDRINTINKLNKDLTLLSKTTTDLKDKLVTMKTPAVALSPYMIAGVNAVQQLRETQLPHTVKIVADKQPPTAPSQPKPITKPPIVKVVL